MNKIKAWGWVAIMLLLSLGWVAIMLLLSFTVAAPFSTLFLLGCGPAVAGKFYFDPPKALSGGASRKRLDK